MGTLCEGVSPTNYSVLAIKLSSRELGGLSRGELLDLLWYLRDSRCTEKCFRAIRALLPSAFQMFANDEPGHSGTGTTDKGESAKQSFAMQLADRILDVRVKHNASSARGGQGKVVVVERSV